MEFKLFGAVPEYVGADWHRDREVADHINQPGHRERLLETLDLVTSTIQKNASIADWGAGNGGLLHELGQCGYAERWGYDLMPQNIDYARTVYNEDVSMLDITGPEPQVGVCTILTEILEHLVKPQDLLWRLRFARSDRTTNGCRFIVASSPAFENPEHHYEFHLWAWTPPSYGRMFERAGWKVVREFIRADCGTQFVVAVRP